MSVTSCGDGDNKQCVHVAETVRMSPAATYNSQSFVRCGRRTRLLFDLVSVFSECLTRWNRLDVHQSQQFPKEFGVRCHVNSKLQHVLTLHPYAAAATLCSTRPCRGPAVTMCDPARAHSNARNSRNTQRTATKQILSARYQHGATNRPYYVGRQEYSWR